MIFAINYSTQAAKLLAEGQIQIDRFKCPNWQDMILEARRQCPVAVHFDLKTYQHPLDDASYKDVLQVMEQTDTPYVNIHLQATSNSLPAALAEATDHILRNEIAERLIADVNALIDRFGAEKVIVENVPYPGWSGDTIRQVVEPAVITKVVEETGCGLLLDISHARMAAHNMGVEEREYLSQLPTGNLREMHFTGVHDLDGALRDHLPALTTDWLLLDWVLERIRKGEWAEPWMLAFEYGGVGEKFAWRSDRQVILDQAPRLYQLTRCI